jgi:hypothetical protein
LSTRWIEASYGPEFPATRVSQQDPWVLKHDEFLSQCCGHARCNANLRATFRGHASADRDASHGLLVSSSISESSATSVPRCPRRKPSTSGFTSAVARVLKQPVTTSRACKTPAGCGGSGTTSRSRSAVRSRRNCAMPLSPSIARQFGCLRRRVGHDQPGAGSD